MISFISKQQLVILIILFIISCQKSDNGNTKSLNRDQREFNGIHKDEYLSRIAFPIGGIGAGMFCIAGPGILEK